MRRRNLKWPLALLALLGGWALPAGPGGAAAAATDMSGLDVVIVIDQSGSMFNSRGTGNDPRHHRIGQAKNIVYRLAEHVEGTALTHRVAVVDFGSAVAYAFPAHLRLAFDPADPGKALREAKTVAERYVLPKSMGDTNTPRALELASEALDKMEASESLTGRHRAVLILTDGRPDLPPLKTLDVLRGEVGTAAEALKRKGVGLWVVGLNDADNYWNEGDGEFWEKIAGRGRARLAETSSTSISALVQEIVNEWLGVKGLAIGKEYECPPYLRRVVFNINFGRPRAPVSVTDPAGKDLPLSSGGAASTPGTFARFVADDPPPGPYRIKQDPALSYTNSVEPFSPNIKRLAPGAKSSRAAEARLLFQATNSRGEPLGLLPDWPVTASVVVTSPSGAAQERPATFEGGGKFAARWQPAEIGVHRVRLKGLVTLKSGAAFDVFGSDAHAYDDRLEVDNSRPYRLRMVSPSPTGGLRLMPWDGSATAEFALLDSEKEPEPNPERVVKDPASWLSLQVVDKSGVPLTAPVPLAPTSSGTFAAAVPVSLDWKGGEGWRTPGALNLRVVAQPSRMAPDAFLDSVELPAEAEEKRVGGDPLTVGPIDVRYSWLVFIPVLLALVLVPASLAWRLLPNGLIWWADSRRHRTVELKIYDGNSDPNGDYAKRLRATSRQSFNYDRKLTLQINGQDYLAKKLRVKRDLAPDVVGATLEYSWQADADARTYTTMLVKGKAQRLRGLPSGDILASLDVNP